MATLDTYAGLKQMVADWLHRSDLTTRIPDFINLAEQTINRRLSIFPKEVEVPLLSVAGSRFVSLPADYDSPVKLQTAYIEPRYDFTMLEASQLLVDDVSPNLPAYWAIDGGKIAFNCPCDQAYPLVFRYLQNVYLSDATPTNAVFARAGDLYLYGALAHSAQFTQDDARLPVWKAEFAGLLAQVAADAARSKGMAPLQTEIPGALLNSTSSRRDWRY